MYTSSRNSQNSKNKTEETCLQKMEEQLLVQWVEEDRLEQAYRFTYIPTFDPPEVLRVSTKTDRKQMLQAAFKLGSPKDNDPLGNIAHQITWTPAPYDWTKLQTSISQNFWQPQTWKPDIQSRGSQWIFEGYRDGEYKRLESWCGRNPRACTLGRAFRHFIPHRLSQKFVYFRSLVGDRLGEIIYEYLEAGQLVQALKLARTHKSDYIKTWLFESDRLFEPWLEFELPNKLLILVEAVETAKTIENRLSQAPILRDLALKYVSVAQLNRALEVARSIEVPYYKVVTLDYLCDRYAAAGRQEEATQIRLELLLSARNIEGDPAAQHLTSLILKHTQLEGLNNKVSRWIKSWLLP